MPGYVEKSTRWFFNICGSGPHDQSQKGSDDMRISRRDLLVASGMFLLSGKRGRGQSAASPLAQQQAGPQARLLEALQKNRLPLTMSDGSPSGRGWDWLVQRARDAHFTLVGEEHGVAETAQLSAALFN